MACGFCRLDPVVGVGVTDSLKQVVYTNAAPWKIQVLIVFSSVTSNESVATESTIRLSDVSETFERESGFPDAVVVSGQL